MAGGLLLLFMANALSLCINIFPKWVILAQDFLRSDGTVSWRIPIDISIRLGDVIQPKDKQITESVISTSKEIAAASELITQLPEGLGESFVDVSKVNEYQTSIRIIEKITGLDFGSLRDHDTYRQGRVLRWN